jgi:hypothetical protein
MMCQSAVEVDDVVVNGMLALAEFGLKLIVLAFYFFTCFLRIFFCIVLTFFFLSLSLPLLILVSQLQRKDSEISSLKNFILTN